MQFAGRLGRGLSRLDLQDVAQQIGCDLADRPALLLRERLGRGETWRSMSTLAVRLISPFPSMNRLPRTILTDSADESNR